MSSDNYNFKSLHQGSRLYDERYNEEVEIMAITYDDRVMLSTNPEWLKSSVRYTVERPLATNRFSVV